MVGYKDQENIKQLRGYLEWCNNASLDFNIDNNSNESKTYSLDLSHSDNVSLRKDGVLSHSSPNL